MMNLQKFESQRGVALALAVIVSFLLFMITFEVAHTTRIEEFIAKNIEIDTRLEVACQAGYEVATARLREDRQQTEIDSMNDGWYALILDTQLIEADVYDEEFLIDDDEDVDFEQEDTELSVKIFDESAKYNIYHLRTEEQRELNERREQFSNVIDLYREDFSEDLSTTDGTTLADELIELMKRTPEVTYRDIPKPKTKSPDTLFCLDEIIYVVGPERLYDISLDEGETIVPGLFRHLTVWSDMQININTAPLAVLAGLFERNDVHLAQRIIDTREELAEEEERGLGQSGLSGTDTNSDPNEEAEDATGGAPFNQINELKEKVDGITQEIYNKISASCTVQSNVFSVYVTARRGLIRRTKMFVVRRTEQGFRKLFEKRVDYPYYNSLDDVEQARDTEADLAQERDR